MDQQIIVDAKAVLALGRFRKIWLLGWLVATVALVALAVQTVRLKAHQAVMAQVIAVQAEQADLQAQQKDLTKNFEEAWKHNQEQITLLTTWGQFVVEKTDMINKNHTNPPINLVRKTP